MKFLGERLYVRRKQMKLTLDEVGERCGLTKATVAKYEKNLIKNVTVDVVGKLAKAVQCSPKYLLDLQDDMLDKF